MLSELRQNFPELQDIGTALPNHFPECPTCPLVGQAIVAFLTAIELYQPWSSYITQINIDCQIEPEKYVCMRAQYLSTIQPYFDLNPREVEIPGGDIEYHTVPCPHFNKCTSRVRYT